MQDRLKSILFNAPLIGAGLHSKPRRLFGSATELADALALYNDTKYGKKDSVRSFLSQVFAGKKTCPSELMVAIEAVIAERIPAEEDERIRKIVRRAFEIQNEEVERKRRTEHVKDMGVPAAELFNEILLHTCTASVQYIITPQTQEEMGHPSARSQLLNNILIYRLKLYAEPARNIAEFELPIVTLDEMGSGASYLFFLPHHIAADAFWENLYRKITQDNPVGGNLDEASAQARLTELSMSGVSGGGGRINVHIPENPTDGAMCAVPIVVFDPSAPHGCAFSFSFDHADIPQVIKWGVDAFVSWQNLFQRRQDRLGFKPYPWSNAPLSSKPPK